MKTKINIFWFRRDLRLYDNHGLYKALKAGNPVLPIFIFDQNILDELEDVKDRRVQFIYEAIQSCQEQLVTAGSGIDVRYGRPAEIFTKLVGEHNVENVYCNDDYEPYSRQRDLEVEELLKKKGIGFSCYKDHVIFEKNEIIKKDLSPYTVFTPYSNAWRAALRDNHLIDYQTGKLFSGFLKQQELKIPPLESMGFQSAKFEVPPRDWDLQLIRGYKINRDYPGLRATSRLGVHLRFGTISIRELARQTMVHSDVFLQELIWRDFYQMILWHFPHVTAGSFKKSYDKIPWRNNEKEFEAWANGMTGYPIVDAGIRELNATGFMHNRVRMIVASFLTKHLLIDWRWGEAYFAKKLLDYDLAANNGGWQWAAGTGCDAAPYFRIFNPALQTKKFDPELNYIRKWVPELDEPAYPPPIVIHEEARRRCLQVYSSALKEN